MRHAAILHVIGRAVLPTILTTAVIIATGSPFTPVAAAPHDCPGVGLHADTAPAGGGHALAGTMPGRGPSDANPETIAAGRHDPAHSEVRDAAAGGMPWLSFMGGSADDVANDLAVDEDGNVYVTGHSSGLWTGDTAPTVRSYSSGTDAFVAKLNSTGELQWKTFLGGDAGWDEGQAIALDADGNIYVAGCSGASWGTPLAGHEYAGQADAFLASLNNAGELQWHIFMGWSYGSDEALGIATYGSDVYVCGYSGDWGAPLYSHGGAEDAFVAKFSGAGALQWHTFIGSTENDVAYSVKVDAAGNIYVGGRRENPGDDDYNGFVAKLSNGEGGSFIEGELEWHTYLGSASGRDEVRGVALTETAVYAAGSSDATWGSPVSAYTAGTDGFVAVLASSDGDPVWHTFLGGNSSDEAHGIDVAGRYIGVAGWSNGTWQGDGGVEPVRPYSGLGDAFVAQLDRTTAQYEWHSFLGSGSIDHVGAIATHDDFIYAAGDSTSSWGEPVEAFSANEDAFVARLGAGHTVGEVWATGANYHGQLGDGTYLQRSAPVQVLLPGDAPLSGVVAIAAGSSHSLALLADGTVRAWGRNNHGQLGDDSNDDSNVPVEVSDLTDVIAIAAGDSHSLAVKADGSAWSWGCNLYGHLGDGSNDNSNVPVQVSGLTGVIAIAAGDNHSLAVKSDGTLWTWGYNWKGQLGDGSSGTGTNRNAPYQVSGLSAVVAAAGGELHSLALLSDGTVRAWGWNGYGQLGNGNYDDKLTPVYVIDGQPALKLSGVSAIAAAGYHSLALKSDGTVHAWGYNSSGQLGDDSTTNSPHHVQVTGLNDAAGVAAGEIHSLALKTDGTVWGWGSGSNGRLAIGINLSQVKVPEEMLNMSDALALAGGFEHSLILRTPAEDTSEDLDIELAAGWNMVSVPVLIGGNTVAEVFAEIDPIAIYTWGPVEGQYDELTDASVIDPARGYWLAVSEEDAGTLTLTGTPVSVDEWSASLSTGWNMVGTAWSANPIPLTDLSDGGSGALQDDAIYRWDAEHKSYELVPSGGNLVPGVGYWMACTAECTVTMAAP